MSQTFEAIIDEHGAVRLLEPIQLEQPRRALVTILDDKQPWDEGSLDAGYRQMAADEAREAEGLELVESTIGDLSDETW
ncbi:MAG: hypothetical protein JWM21_781 [Acidobacteria bacterium]|nr:hypothetical protein [Acidobacteriota bacterium]